MSSAGTKKAKVLGSMSLEGRDFGKDFIDFLNEACTAFHAVEACRKRLLAAGFVELSEAAAWPLARGGKYFFTRNSTTILAFTVGGAYEAANGFTALGAHTDSPCFKIKPVTCITKGDSLMINTQPYGGGLWHTWFDRDLGVAGRLIIRGEGGRMESRLVRIDEPVARIPCLAIHLTSGAERERFEPNLQEHCQALLSMNPEVVKAKPTEAEEEVSSRFHPGLLRLVAARAGLPIEAIEDMELQLIDVQPSAIGGASGEFIFSGRLDNLCSTYQCLRAVIDSSAGAALDTQRNVCLAMLFDHEEVGSASAQGAGSSLFMDTLRRINAVIADSTHETLMRSLRKSFVVSVDMAHGHHPNYMGKHDSSMAPKINGGLVIKHNANQRYATNALSASLFRRIGKLALVPVQEFSVRSDSGCGSTIGPIIATLSGILTVDCGTPQFSMHSIREMMGLEDAHTGYLHLKAVFEHHAALAAEMESK